MDARGHKKVVYAGGIKKGSNLGLYQMAIIVAFVFMTTLISVLLQVYFALLPLNGG